MSAILNIPKKLDDSVSKLLEAQDIEPEEDGEIILRRVISRSGSRNFINGSSVPLQILRELGEQFIDIFQLGNNTA